jgi:hypothetical protein
MFAFRESYEDVAFLYVSDDMDWARKNLKDKHHDLVRKFYFVEQILFCRTNFILSNKFYFVEQILFCQANCK